MRRLLIVVLLGFLVGCGEDRTAELKAGDAREALLAEIATLKKEISQKEARGAAQMDQLKDEAAQKVELMKEIERVKPMVERVEAAEKRVEEVEEMIKEVKKLE